MKTWHFSSGHPDLQISHPVAFFWGFVKDAVFKNLNDLRNRITAAVNSVTHGIRHQVWDELNYRLDVIRAAEGEHNEHL